MRVVSRRRLASTTIGVILSVAIIFSIFTLGNNISKAQLYDYLENEDYHISMTAYIQTGNYTKIVSELRDISHVSKVYCMIVETIDIERPDLRVSINIGYYEGAENVTVISGTYPSNLYEVAISRDIAEEYNISPGEYINASHYQIYTGKTNSFTLHVVGIFQKSHNTEMLEALTTPKTMGAITKYANLYGGIKVDPDYLASSRDMNEIHKKLYLIKGEVYDVISKYGEGTKVNVDFGYYPNITFSVMYLGFVLPIIAMGAYLSKVGIGIELKERRREFGIMRIRGASNAHRFRMLLYEAIIYSIVGGILGYILGEFLAYGANITMMKLPFFQMDWGWEYAVGAIITALVLFFVALYKPWKKISSVPMVELISHYTQSFKSVEYSPTKDIIKSAVMWGYLIIGIYTFQNVSFNGGFNVLVLVAIIVLFTLSFMFPIILIFLPLYMSRILTLGTQKLYVYLAGAIARVTGVAGELVKKGVSRNPKNIAYIAFILAFILTFSSFISATYDNVLLSSDLISVQSSGGDFKIKNFIEPKDYITHSKNVSSYVWVEDDYEGSMYDNALHMIYCNFHDYTHTVYHLDIFLKEGKFEEGKIVITDYLAKTYSLHIGDVVRVYTENGGYERYTIGGIVYSFPGFGQDGSGAIMINRNVDPQNATALILKARNYNALKGELLHLGYSRYDFVERKSAYEDYTSIILSVIDVFMILLGGATILIIQYSLYFNRRGEISLYKVRGATRRQIANILMVEGGTVILISVIVGIVIGLTLSYLFTTFYYSTSYLPTFFVVGYNFTIVTTIMTLVFLAMQYAISLAFARVKMSEVLRALGGEM